MDSSGTQNRGGQALLEDVLNEQSVRWSRGERPGAEEYFDRFPVLRDNPDAALDVIYQEFILRRDSGERPQPEEFIRRFPFFSKLLIAQLATDEAMRSTATTTELPKGRDVGQAVDRAEVSTVVHDAVPDDRGSFHFFPGYELLGVIGRGGMGVVYKARHTRLGRVVALKTITELEPAKPDQLARFLDEARAAARLQHPNIIAVHEIGEHQGRPYFAQEFVDGGDLKKQVAQKPMAVRQSAVLLETLARAVHAAHKAGIVHRDLKPSNILLTTEGVPKVADFGLAKLLGGDSGRTQSGQVVGTPSYMAPEQAEGRSKDVGPVADVYALGAIMYEALTGRPPFLGDSQIETLRLVCSAEPVSPKRLRPDIPRDLETICLKCLAKEPHKRYESADVLAEDLRRFLEDRPITARHVGQIGRLRRWGRRNPWVAGLSASVVATMMVGTVVSAILAIRATRAERWARSAAADARKERDRAESQAQIAAAANEFLNEDLLAQASTYSQLSLHTEPDPDLKVRTILDRAAEHIGDRFAGQPLVEASIRQTIGGAYLELGLYPQARPHLERALELCRSAPGDHEVETLRAMRNLGSLDYADGKWTEARSLLVPAMEGLQRARGLEDPDTLTAMKAVAELNLDQNKNLPEAESLASQVRDVLLRTREATDPKTLDATNTLALVLSAQNKWEEARGLLVNVIEELTSQLTIDHPRTLMAMHNLAQMYDEIGEKSRAEKLWTEVLGRQRKVLGNGHPHTLITMARLAYVYLWQDGQEKLDKAESLFIEAVKGCRAGLDRNHETATGALGGLAAVYMKKGDLKKVGPVLIESRNITRVRYGPHHRLTAGANRAVGMFFLGQREYDKAGDCFGDCLTYWVKNGPSQGDRFFNELQYGVCLLAQRKYTEAKNHLLVGYNGIRQDREHSQRELEVDLGWLVEQVYRLRDANGHPFSDTTLSILHKDPALWAIVLDLQFPADPFAPP